MSSIDTQKPKDAIVGITTEERRRAKTSYFLDCIGLISAVLFTGVFVNAVSEFRGGTGTGYFDPKFVEEGFCNHPELPTMQHCAFFDWAMAAFLLFFGYRSPQPDYAAIGYMIGHGQGHWEAHINPLAENPEISKPIDILLLSIIIGFAGCNFIFLVLSQNKGWGKTTSALFAGSLLASMCYIYAVHIQYKVFSLTFINMSILLMLNIGRAFFLGYESDEDIKFRSKMMGLKSRSTFISCYAAEFLIMAITWLEPLTCSAFFSHIGGHFWFDVALFIQVCLGMKNNHAEYLASSAAIGTEGEEKKNL